MIDRILPSRTAAPGARYFSLIIVALCASLLTVPASAVIEYTRDQSATAKEIIDQLEQRHYAKLKYDEKLADEHFDNFIDQLDGGRMFFTRDDLKALEPLRGDMVGELRRGQLDVGFTIFNRFHERMLARLQVLTDTLPEMVEAMDFSLDETFIINGDDRRWARSQEELDERWRKHVKNQVLGLRLADKAEDEIVPTLLRRYRNQLHRIEQYNAQDAFQLYANSLTELYDPHTNYLSPRRSENFNINMRLSLEGIGAVLQLEDEYTRVARIVHAGPADKHGVLQPSDRIIAVGQGDEGPLQDVVGWRLDEVVDLIRGKKGTTVRLQILPAKGGSDAEPNLISIVRNKVQLEEQSAQKRILELPGDDGGVVKLGVIDIPAFYIDFEAMRRGDEDYKSTTRDVRKLIDELEAENVAGIVIDLRNNGGGSLQEANELTGLFIEYGPTVQIRHSSRRVWRDGKRMRSTYYDGPMLVLINRLSASASEIFAGAIQDYGRGLVVGDRSYGKGTVQTMVPLTEGQLKITESKFYRISGDSTQHRGVVPDIALPSLYDPDEIGESSLDHALDWDQINPIRHRSYGNQEDLIPDLTAILNQRTSDNPEFRYLQDQLAMVEENRQLREVSLNEAQRRAEREERELRQLAMENARRAALGLDAVETLAALDELETAEAEAAVDQNSSEASAATGGGGFADQNLASSAAVAPREDVIDASSLREEDVLLAEAGNILLDAMQLSKSQFALQTAQRNKR